jgi:hypothetical protein
MAQRIINRYELLPEAKKGLEAISDMKGMTQVAILSRLLEWFADQSELVQGAVLGLYPKEIQPEVAELILKQMSKRKK